MLNPGSEIGDPSRRYRITRDIGRGGMGEVYEGVQLALNRRVAIKTIRDDLSSRSDLLARFRREAESAAALGHPNLVQVTDFQTNPGEPPFLVMEMLEGSTLKDELEQSGKIDPSRAAFIGAQVLSGLAAAHRLGIIHRDVKPANLFLQSTTAMRDIVKVLDFGIAKLAIDSVAAGTELMTRVGQVLGTLSYMAPEQGIVGTGIDARTDIYAVGATLFHAVAGVRPYEVTEPGGARAPLSRIAPWVNPELASVIERAIERMPDNRWPSADAMMTALAPFAGANSGPGRISNSGWDPSAIGRLEAPTGGGTGFDPSLALAPTALPAPMIVRPSSNPHDVSVHNASSPAPMGAMPYTPPPPPQLSPAAMTGYAPPPAYSLPPPYGAPAGYGTLPSYGAPMYPAAPFGQQPQMPAPRSGMPMGAKIAIAVVVGAFLLMTIVPAMLSAFAVRRATNPQAIATTVDKQMLLQTRPPCPAPDSCTLQREENGLKYPLCTRKLPNLSPYKIGDFVLATGDEAHIGVVMSEPAGKTYRVRMLTAQQETSMDDSAIVGRLCTPGQKRTNDGKEVF